MITHALSLFVTVFVNLVSNWLLLLADFDVCKLVGKLTKSQLIYRIYVAFQSSRALALWRFDRVLHFSVDFVRERENHFLR